MKKLLLSIVLICFVNIVNAQWTNKTMLFGGLTRSYRVYKSPNYNSNIPASLLIALHGLGDNMTNFSTIGFSYIADTANIICVFPQAVSDPFAGTAWNSGAGEYGYYPNSTVDDIGFINAIIDTAKANYSIDRSRVYLCGFSMGGFMTEKMALLSNTKIAAFGSMSGTFGNQITSYHPGRHVPIAHFHGTSDSTVYYTGDLYGIDPDSLIHFWVNNNSCNIIPDTFTYPNTASDSITVERFEYSNGDPQSDVWFFKMYGAGHTVLFQPTNDITEPIELWLFFRRHTYASAGINDQPDLSNDIMIFPNPVINNVTIEIPQQAAIEILNIHGQLIKSIATRGNKISIDVSDFPNGVYVVEMKTEKRVEVRRFIIAPR
jgi:polyhydroxybutyrate depolymerase